MKITPPPEGAFSAVSDARGRPQIAVWRWPIALGALTVFGLFSALLGQKGLWLVLSWISLSIPFIVTVVCLLQAWCVPSVKGGRS